MRKVDLEWFNLGSVQNLYEYLKPDDYFRKLSSEELKTIGLYMFIDKADQARYIGQAFNNKQYPLAHRVRWEIVKNGAGCAESAFFQKCTKYAVDRFDFTLKVAHIKNPLQDGSVVEEEDKETMKFFINAVERALIFKMATLGQPLMNETGKTSYKLGPIEIANSKDHIPLPKSICL
ncbi:MAG: hypothetical protein ABSA75_00590 [Candidatus Bathyarchaeia archaeon]|jgi:hypothetical protein